MLYFLKGQTGVNVPGTLLNLSPSFHYQSSKYSLNSALQFYMFPIDYSPSLSCSVIGKYYFCRNNSQKSLEINPAKTHQE